MSSNTREIWDGHAATFDDEADHGLRNPEVSNAWSALMTAALPAAPAAVVDLGCGTGSLSVLLAQAGHHVHGLDVSARMLELAQRKATGRGAEVTLVHGDASHPPFRPASFDVVLARHVLWALPEPGSVLARWVTLLRPGGRLVLIEGKWATGAGLSSPECVSLVRQHRRETHIKMLNDHTLWGRAITDERYLLLSRS